MEDIIAELDKIDAELRRRLATGEYDSLPLRNALKEARKLLQEIITILLDAH